MTTEVRAEIEDAATGNTIAFFYRAGRPTLMLRDAVTGRFIKRLLYVGIVATNSIEYESKSRPWHNIYIDANATTAIDASEFPNREEIELMLADAIYSTIVEKFGLYIAAYLDETKTGIQYRSDITSPLYPVAEVELIWWHRQKAGLGRQEVHTVLLRW
jgi:hypothetical protein